VGRGNIELPVSPDEIFRKEQAIILSKHRTGHDDNDGKPLHTPPFGFTRTRPWQRLMRHMETERAKPEMERRRIVAAGEESRKELRREGT
jgi:hypothetical protein